MSLQDWLKFGWLREHKTSRQEIADLFAVADRDLEACRTPGLVSDWQFNIAYNAALQFASAALAAAGYEAERANHHYRVIHSLEFTLGVEANFVRPVTAFWDLAALRQAQQLLSFTVNPAPWGDLRSSWQSVYGM